MRAGLGTELIFRYPAVKLLDKAAGCEEILQKGKNPFAWITRAHCDALATNKNEPERFLRKKEMARLLYCGGFSREVVHDIVWFFDWVLWLPEEYDSSFRLYLGELEDEMGKQYVPSWERLAAREALQKGRKEIWEEFEQKVIAQISRALEKRLNGGSQPYIANIAHLSDGERDELFDLLIDTTDAEKIKAWFAAHPGKKTS